MRRMISEKKQKLLDKQSFDADGTIVDENDREFNGDVAFTGTVTGVGEKLYIHNIQISNTGGNELNMDVITDSPTGLVDIYQLDGYRYKFGNINTYMDTNENYYPLKVKSLSFAITGTDDNLNVVCPVLSNSGGTGYIMVSFDITADGYNFYDNVNEY